MSRTVSTAALLLIYLRSIVACVYLIITVVLSYLSALGASWILIHYGLDMPAILGLIPLYLAIKEYRLNLTLDWHVQGSNGND